MMYPVAILVVCIMVELSIVTSGANFTLSSQNYNDIYCVEFTSNYGIRSTVDCALRAAGMAYYDNSFAYRDGKCYLCRADNVNCAASQTEFRLVGPHYFKGKINIHSVMKLIGHNLVWIPHEEYLLCEDLFSICLYIITTSVTCFSLRVTLYKTK